MNSVIKNLLRLMEERNMNAVTLCRECKLNHSAITDWKNGKSSPSRKTLDKLAKYFDVPIGYFYDNPSLQTENLAELTPGAKRLLQKLEECGLSSDLDKLSDEELTSLAKANQEIINVVSNKRNK